MISREGSDTACRRGPWRSVVDRNGVEFFGDATGFFNFAANQLAEIEMHVTRYELGEGVGDSDNRFLEVFVFHTGRTPEARAPAMLRPWVEVLEQ